MSEEEEKKVNKKFEKLVKPLMKFLSDNYHPRVYIVITPTSAEILEGLAGFNTDEFIKD